MSAENHRPPQNLPCQKNNQKQVLLKLVNKAQEIRPEKPRVETLQQERDQVQFQVKAMKSAFRELCTAKEMQVNSLQNNLGRLEKERENLQVRLEDLEYKSTEEQNRLKTTEEEQHKVIRALKADLIRSNKERESLTVQLQENKAFAEEYRNMMKEIKRRHSLKNNKNINPQMHKLICHNTVPMEKLDRSKSSSRKSRLLKVFTSTTVR